LFHAFRLGEGLVGQCAVEKQPILLANAPDDYVKINSGLGEAKPLTIIAQPIVYDDAVLGVLELASFATFTDIPRELLNRLAGNLGVIIQKIWNQQRTERLLGKSQELGFQAQVPGNLLLAGFHERDRKAFYQTLPIKTMKYETLYDATVVSQFYRSRLNGRLSDFFLRYNTLFYCYLSLTVNFLPFAPGTPISQRLNYISV
jgi:signal transduction protein with GAF and PtsI domain